MSKASSWRSAAAVRLSLVAALAAAAFMGAYDYVSADSSQQAEGPAPSQHAPSSSTSAEQAPVAPFTSADTGSCLTWDIAADGAVSNFEETSCGQPHRFEVATREDLSTFPTSEFGPEAKIPDLDRQNALRDELCESATIGYLKGKFDPAGKYDIASILPPAPEWERGDRTMLCGLQTTDAKGVPQLSTGNVAAVDQAIVAKPGECVALDDQQRSRTVDCGQPHQLETVSVVNLAEHFGDKYPSDGDVDSFLSETCTAAAQDYLGGEENLYQSTLQPFWGSISESAWNGGSRSVNCSLIHSKGGGFSEITGSATGGREALTINGAPPAPQPERKPLRNQPGAPAAGQ